MFHSVYPTSMTRARRDASSAFWVPEPVRVVKVSFSYGFMGDLEEVLQAHPVIHRSIQLPQPKMSKDKPLQQSLLVHSDGLYGPYCSVVCLRSLEDVDGLVGGRLLVAFDVTTCEKLETCDTDTVTLSFQATLCNILNISPFHLCEETQLCVLPNSNAMRIKDT